MPDLQDRVSALEARVADVERLLRSGERAQPVPAAAPPRGMPEILARAREVSRPAAEPGPPRLPALPSPRRQTAPSPVAPADPVPLERYLGVTVLGRAGAAALFLAAVYFAQLGWNALGPVSKVGGIYLLGAVLLGLGLWLQPRVTSRYVALLWGAAVADLYLAGAVAKLVYDLVSAPVALGLLVAACAVGQVLALRLRRQALATIALTGAALAPLLTGADSGSPTLLLTYLLAVHTWSASLEARMQWSAARAVGLLGTGSVALLWFTRHWQPEVGLLLHAHLFQLGLAAPEILCAWRRRPLTDQRRLLVSGSAAALSLGFMQLAFSQRLLPAYPLAAGTAWFAAAFAVAPRHAAFGRDLGRLAGVLLAAAALIAWPTVWDVGLHANQLCRALALLAVVVVSLASQGWLGVGSMSAALASGFVVVTAPVAAQPWSVLPLGFVAILGALCHARAPAGRLAALCSGVLLCTFAVLRHASDPRWPPLHLVVAAIAVWLALATWRSVRARDAIVARATGYSVILLTLAWAGAVFVWICTQQDPSDGLLVNARALAFVLLVGAAVVVWHLHAVSPRASKALAVALLAAAYVAGLGELLGLLPASASTWRAAAASLYSTVFGVVLLVAGFRWRVQALRFLALAVLFVVTIKVGFYDLAHLPTPLRVLVTAALGTLQLGAAWGFARVHRRNSARPASTR